MNAPTDETPARAAADPNRPDHPAAFFFLGAFDPAELANFNVQNEPMPNDDAVFEAVGHGVGIWWRNRRRRDVDALKLTTREWLESVAALYFLSMGAAFDVVIAHWVETLTPVDEAVLGFVDRRYRHLQVVAEDAPTSRALRLAHRNVGALWTAHHLLPAAKEAWHSALDPSDEAFLSAFRALECIRRTFQSAQVTKAQAWEALRTNLGVDREPLDVLTHAAEAVRHGDRPAIGNEGHPINGARKRRAELLKCATDIVRKRLRKEPGVTLDA